MKANKTISLLVLLTILTVSVDGTAQAKTREQINEVLDVYVDECYEHWDEYHVYPSCMAMIGAQESLFGTAGRANNHWGLVGGKASYATLEDGIHAFMRCVNDPWYHGAEKANSGDEQLKQLLKYGYCQPPGDYYSYAMRLKSMYNLGELDERMFRRIKAKARKQRKLANKKYREQQQKLMFHVVHDPTLAPWQVVTYRGTIKGGTIRIRYSDTMGRYTWRDVVGTKKGKHRIIYTGDRFHALVQPIVYLDDVCESAKG